MAKRYVFNFTFLLLLFGAISSQSLAAQTSNYDEYGLERRSICNVQVNTVGPKILGKIDEILSSADKKHVIKMSNTKSSGLIVKANNIFDRWSGILRDKYCKFHVKANKGDGLFGVIQKLSFRHNGSQCLDYVQFRRADGYRTKRFCGQIDHGKAKFYPNPETEQNSDDFGSLSSDIYAEFDQEGFLETTIFVSKEALLPGQALDVAIAYTPYKDCRNIDSDAYRRVKLKSDMEICMSKEFFCDGYQNCAPNLCSDEADCYDGTNDVTMSNGTGTKVTVGAVTTIFLCFIIFVMCLWICKRNNKLCWSSDCAGPPACSERPVVALPTEREGTANIPVPSAPMLEVAESPLGADKDLPPSYESLFPEQNNPATS